MPLHGACRRPPTPPHPPQRYGFVDASAMRAHRKVYIRAICFMNRAHYFFGGTNLARRGARPSSTGP
jgi:hypothetical protein